MGRLVFAPIAVAMGAIYAATLAPGSEWLQTHSFGLGGLFGDTVMGAILTILPIGSTFTVKLMSLLMGAAILVFGAFVLGFTKAELHRLGRFLLLGVIMTYALLMTVLGRGANGALHAAQGLQARQAGRRERQRAELDQQAAYAPGPQTFRAPAAPQPFAGPTPRAQPAEYTEPESDAKSGP